MERKMERKQPWRDLHVVGVETRGKMFHNVQKDNMENEKKLEHSSVSNPSASFENVSKPDVNRDCLKNQNLSSREITKLDHLKLQDYKKYETLIDNFLKNNQLEILDVHELIDSVANLRHLPQYLTSTLVDTINSTHQKVCDKQYFRNLKEQIRSTFTNRNVPADILSSLKLQHTAMVEEKLSKYFPFYLQNSLLTALKSVRITTETKTIDFESSDQLRNIRASLRNYKLDSCKRNKMTEPNAMNLNFYLKDFVMGGGGHPSSNIFSAVSKLFVGDESLQTALQILTYQQTIDDDQFILYCLDSQFSVSDTRDRILSNNSYATPPMLEFMSQMLQKNVVLFVGSNATEEGVLVFGNFVESLHVIAVDWKFYPLYPINPNPTFVGYVFPVTRNCKPTSNTEMVEHGVDFTNANSNLFTSCNFCVDFRLSTCSHVLSPQVFGLTEIRQLFLNKALGSFSALEVNQQMWCSIGILPTSLKGKVVPVKSTADGNCLFHAVSLCLTKTEKLSNCLQKALLVDFQKNQNHYYTKFKELNLMPRDIAQARRSIYMTNKLQPEDWPNSINILLVSKIITRKIIVYSNVGSHTERIMYDLNHEQSAEFKPILLLCKGLNHFTPLIPYDWDTLKLPETTMNRYRKMNDDPVSDLKVSAASNLLKSIENVPSAIETHSNETELSGQDASSVKTDEPGECVKKLQKPGTLKEHEYKEFLQIVAKEAFKMSKFQCEENICSFANNISRCWYEFWKANLQEAHPHRSESELRKKANKYMKITRTDFGKQVILNQLEEIGISPKLIDVCAAQIAKNNAGSSVPVSQRRHAIEKTRFGLQISVRRDQYQYTEYVSSESKNESNDSDQGCENSALCNLQSNKVQFEETLKNHTCEANIASQQPKLASEYKPDVNLNSPVKNAWFHLNDETVRNVLEENEKPETKETLTKKSLENDDSDYKYELSESDSERSSLGDASNSDKMFSEKELLDIAKSMGMTQDELTFQPPKSFTIEIPAEDASRIYDYESQRFIHKKWGGILSKYLTKTQGCCSFTAKRGVTYPKKEQKGFCSMEGSCSGYCNVKFTASLATAPERGFPIQVSVHSTGAFHLLQTKSTGRQLRGVVREDMGKELSHSKPIKVLSQNTADLANTRLLHNNHDQRSLASLKVLRSEKIKSVMETKTPASDLECFRNDLRKNDSTSKIVKGYVQHRVLTDDELCVHLYTEKTLSMLNTLTRNSKVCIHFDATGSVVKKVGEKQVLLYTALVRTTKNICFPLAEMLSQRGRELEISDFLKRVFYDMRLICPNSNNPLGHIIVTDFSFAMLNGVSSGANKMGLREYIRMTWSVLNEKQDLDKDRAIIFICTSHLVHSAVRLFSRHTRMSTETKQLRHLAVHAVVKFQESTDIKQMFRAMDKVCRFFGNKFLPECERDKLKSWLLSSDTAINIAEEVESNKFCDEISFEYFKEVKKSSPCYTLFSRIRERDFSPDEGSEEDRNPFYSKTILDVIHNNHAPYVSLYSAMMLSKTSRSEHMRLTNASVESEFKTVKNLYHTETISNYSAFVRRHYTYHMGKINAVLPKAQNIAVTKTTKVKKRLNRSANAEIGEETWKKRKLNKSPKYVATDSRLRCRKKSQAAKFNIFDSEISNLMNTQSEEVEAGAPNTELNEATKIRIGTPEINSAIDDAIYKNLLEFALETKGNQEINEDYGVEDFEEDIKAMFRNSDEELKLLAKAIANNEARKAEIDSKRKAPLAPTGEDNHLESGANCATKKVTEPLKSNFNKAATDDMLHSIKQKYNKQVVGRTGDTDNTLVPSLNIRFEEVVELLQNKSWLTDQHVDFCLAEASKRNVESKYKVSRSHFVYEGVGDGAGKIEWLRGLHNDKDAEEKHYDKFLQTSHQEDNYILHPLQRVNHWVLLCINKTSKTCIILDSNRSSRKSINRVKELEIRNNALSAFVNDSNELNQWTVCHSDNFPMQTDGSSCALFVVKAIEEILQLDPSFDLESSLLPSNLSFLRDSKTDVEFNPCKNLDVMGARLDLAKVILETTDTGLEILEAAQESEINLRKIFTPSREPIQHTTTAKSCSLDC